MLTRRHFLTGAAGLTATTASGLPCPAFAQSKPKVVIIGGGVGGASVVRALVTQSSEKLDITVVEPKKTYTTCFYSNLYLGGFQPFEVLQHGFDAIAGLPGVTVAHDTAKTIDRDKREVRLASGAALSYDRLVLSPGIALDYNSVPGWSKDAEDKMPHAWQAGLQTELLKRQLDAVPDGGLIVMIAPPNPYRCPPGPYERVSMMAHVLKVSGRTKAQIIILDPKEKFSKQGLFQAGWETHYPGMVQWLSPMIHGGIKSVDPASMTVTTDFETYKNAALVNVIPRQIAGRIAVDSGLTEATGYCPIDPFTMKSAPDEMIYVLGDASIAGDMPKSAFAANSQAQVVAQALSQELFGANGEDLTYQNRCWSLIDTDDSVVVGGSYQPTPDKIEQTKSDISSLEDTAETRRKNFEDGTSWYANLTAELYG